jgi:hypothetical protein
MGGVSKIAIDTKIQPAKTDPAFHLKKPLFRKKMML